VFSLFAAFLLLCIIVFSAVGTRCSYCKTGKLQFGDVETTERLHSPNDTLF